MNVEKRHMLLAGFGVLALALIASRLMSTDDERQADLPGGVEFLCEPEGHEARFTKQQLSDFYKENFGHPLRCPECDSDRMVRAARNPKDGKLYKIDREGPTFAPNRKPFEGSRL